VESKNTFQEVNGTQCKFIFIRQCYQLHRVLPEEGTVRMYRNMFGETDLIFVLVKNVHLVGIIGGVG